MIRKHASAKWSGDLRKGKGYISTETGALDNQPYGFNTRFEDKPGTNPEEILGAAHAACFTMALSMILGEAGLESDDLATKATVTLDKVDDAYTITKIHLDVTAKFAQSDEEAFKKAARKAKENCPVSRVLNAEITMEAKLA